MAKDVNAKECKYDQHNFQHKFVQLNSWAIGQQTLGNVGQLGMQHQ